MAKEQLAVIEMVTNMILGKTEGISKVDFVPQKTRCPEPENGMHMHDKVPVIQDQDIEKTKNQQQIFPRKTPESQGIVSDHLRYLIQELADSPNTDMHHFMVLRHGNVICEADFAPYRKGIWHITHSMCKSITGMAVGFLVEEGKLELSENIYKIFSDKGSTWPFAGAGTTVLAAVVTGYRAVGIEVTDAYYKLGSDRVRIALEAEQKEDEK